MTAGDAPREIRRVLICEDSPTYAAGLSRLLSREHDIEVVGVCSSAEEAIARVAELAVKPDLMTMDLELPGMSGGEAIEQIMSVQPMPILVLSGSVSRGSERALETLGAGALEVLSKDALDLRDPDGVDARAFRRRVRLLSGVRVVRHPRARLNGHVRASTGGASARRTSVVGICASAGGPHAVAAVLAAVPADFKVPILIVQHITTGFVEGLVHWLDGQVPLTVRLAAPGPIQPGVWVAPEGAHLLLDGRKRLALDDRDDGEKHRPSGNVLLRSIAEHAGAEAAAVVLTGMGRDGAEGLGAVQRAGGLTIAQDEATSTVFGMPKAAAECGAALVLPPAEIGRRLSVLRPAEVST
ncbi:MAG TPA: chemotaxis protein CheB [Solirubrobacteraceae bacterium]|nr:chemotaxis protein CheB [Solirubrobacteraceae bacterium]